MTSLLWVTAEVPDTSLGGGHIREAHLLQAVARRMDVHLLVAGAVQDDAVRSCVSGLTEIQAARPPRPRTNLRRRLSDLRHLVAEGEPKDVVAHREVCRRLARAREDLGPFDVVSVEHAGLAPLVRVRNDETWSITVHNVISRRLEQAAAVARGRRQRWLLERDRAKALRFERWLAASFDVVVTVSAEDAASLPGRRVLIVPNGVDSDRFRPTPIPEAPRLVFTGTLSYRPNVDAARWFCAEVQPLVQASVPGVSLDIVGRSPVAEVTALDRVPGVAVHADVADVRPYLERARAAVVPVREGTGTRLKVLEAMAAGRPVVGTSIGLEGLGLLDGETALFADDPAAMAGALVRLLGEDRLARSLAAAGRSWVEAHYRWDAIGADFAGHMLAVAGH